MTPNSTEERVALVASAIAPHCYNGPSARLGAEAAIEALTRTDNDVSGLVEALEAYADIIDGTSTTGFTADVEQMLLDLTDETDRLLAKHRQSNGGAA